MPKILILLPPTRETRVYSYQCDNGRRSGRAFEGPRDTGKTVSLSHFRKYSVAGCRGSVAGCRGLSRVVAGCRGLSRAVAGGRGLSRVVAVLSRVVADCRGLSRVVAGCRGLSRVVARAVPSRESSKPIILVLVAKWQITTEIAVLVVVCLIGMASRLVIML